MSGSIWERLNHFNKFDHWGTPSKMSHRLLLLLDETRHFVGTPFHITSAYDLSRSKNSTHREGKAVDFVMPHNKRHPLDILIALERFDWGGIGYYPHWKWGDKRVGGWHLDVRTREKHSPSARWMGVLGENGKQKYVALSYANLVKYKVIS